MQTNQFKESLADHNAFKRNNPKWLSSVNIDRHQSTYSKGRYSEKEE